LAAISFRLHRGGLSRFGISILSSCSSSFLQLAVLVLTRKLAFLVSSAETPPFPRIVQSDIDTCPAPLSTPALKVLSKQQRALLPPRPLCLDLLFHVFLFLFCVILVCLFSFLPALFRRDPFELPSGPTSAAHRVSPPTCVRSLWVFPFLRF